MSPETRACVALVVIRLLNPKNGAARVFDHGRGRYIEVDGDVTPTSVDLYDFTRGAYFGGEGGNGNFYLYDYGTGYHLDLELRENQYVGFDYGSSCHFSGSVGEMATTMYDHAESALFEYRV